MWIMAVKSSLNVAFKKHNFWVMLLNLAMQIVINQIICSVVLNICDSQPVVLRSDKVGICRVR